MNGRSARHTSQSGTTLVELLVATVIMGLALAMLIGMFSTGAIDSRLAKRDAAAQAATEYELDKIGSQQFSGAAAYSECFASNSPTSPVQVGYQGSCPGSASLRADVAVAQVQGNLQQWTIVVNSLPESAPIGKPVSTLRVNR